MNKQHRDTPRRHGLKLAALLLLLVVGFAPTAIAEPDYEGSKLVASAYSTSGRYPSTAYEDNHAVTCYAEKASSGNGHAGRVIYTQNDYNSFGTFTTTAGRGHVVETTCGYSFDSVAGTGRKFSVISEITSGLCQFYTVDSGSLTSLYSFSFGCSSTGHTPFHGGSNSYAIFDSGGYHYYNGTGAQYIAFGGAGGSGTTALTVVGTTVYGASVGGSGIKYFSFSEADLGSVIDTTLFDPTAYYSEADPQWDFDAERERFVGCAITTTGDVKWFSTASFIAWDLETVTTGTTATSCDPVVSTNTVALGNGQIWFYNTTSNAYEQGTAFTTPSGFVPSIAYNTDTAKFSILDPYSGNLYRKLYADTPGAVTPADTSLDTPIAEAKSYVIDAWGISEDVGNWLFGIATVGLISFAFIKMAPGNAFVALVGFMMGVGLATAFGFIPVWFLLLLAMFGSGIAAKAFFGGSEGDA